MSDSRLFWQRLWQRWADRGAAGIVLTYLVVASLWIGFSDLAVEAVFHSSEAIVHASLIKGWLFVIVTAVMLYALITKLLQRIDDAHAAQRRERANQRQRLERMVRARTAELEAANAELDAFTYAVSHDLRAPLRAMSGFARALEEDQRDALDDAGRMYLDQITTASAHMGALIDALLTLSRTTRGELDPLPVDIAEITRRQLSLLAAQQPERRVDAQLPETLTVHGDPRMLEALVTNLIDNAWKYTGERPNAEIRLTREDDDGHDGFVIEDNGAGFDMRHAGALFTPFQRLHRQDEFPGIGVGLATVQRIVTRHGGKIEAAGVVGQGARFRILLPRRSGSAADSAAPASDVSTEDAAR
ncbi:MAG: ATP-binding protein [Wenzhouxiangellaceae bacterium]|nr:ATP-binding protein [Wenzhouxiangellaceae bacterium]